jgi:hypothetical protein
VFQAPRAIDVKKTESLPTPEAFRGQVATPQIAVLPLLRERPSGAPEPGWCTYTYEFDGAPELEFLGGGVNHKTPRAGAVWRQGHLLHFGFEPSPDRMSEAGRALLVNAVCYAARFTEDRPIIHTASVFLGGTRIFDRDAVGRLLADRERDAKQLEWYVSKDTYAQLKGKSRDEVRAWYRGAVRYLHADKEGLLEVDADAQRFGVPPARLDFLDRATAALADPDRAPLARTLLGRYAPDAPAGEWVSWLKQNRDYLFFSDAGGYRWYVDPLAKKRGVPTARLRGPDRASRTVGGHARRQPAWGDAP